MVRVSALLFLAACQFGAPMTPQLAEESTYKIYTPDFSQGTAWVVGEHQLITAGHVCDSGPGEYVLVSSTGRRLVARPVAWQDTDEGDPVDVCLMESDSDLAPPLKLADHMPRVGQLTGYVGYPLGELTHSTGVYLGDTDGPGEQWNNYVSSAPCDHGASGSAMYSDDGVYGVLVRIQVFGDRLGDPADGCAASPLYQILDILD